MPVHVDPIEVKKIFDYIPESGRLVRRTSGRGTARAGDLAGTVYPNGYRRANFKNRIELTHRMVWAWNYGVSPDFHIAHINGDRSDDRIENLANKSDLIKSKKIVVCQSELRRLFHYEDSTGNLIRKLSTSHNAKKGAIAGGVRPDGYVAIHLGGKAHLAHRLIWVYVHGQWPKGELDHINRDRGDNRLENLRDVTRDLNVTNTPGRGINGFKGVSRVGERFFSRIKLGGGETKYLGTYDTPEEAHAFYVKAHIERYGEMSEYYNLE